MSRKQGSDKSIYYGWALVIFGIIHIMTFAGAQADSFKVASYNVENLFDLHSDETDYPDYRPGGKTGWNKKILAIKLKNIAAVINDLDAGVVGLQEVESKNALILLQQTLESLGAHYPYQAIAEERSTPVKCALLSRFPIVEKKEIFVGLENARSILKVTLEVDGYPFIVYVNHWKSKSGPESKRIQYARVLAGEISKLGCTADFILMGDFNSDYNEYETVKHIARLNDTRGVTGINHILNTVRDARMVTESVLRNQPGCVYLYNLWLEIPVNRRWSVNFFGRKNSPDSIIVSKGLYDTKGISYVDNSFDKFDPDYLFENDRVFRWQRADRGKGRHLGKGYSDHLPVVAEFTAGPFVAAPGRTPVSEEPEIKSVADLYDVETGAVNFRINGAVVIYKDNGNAVIKQKNGRAIFVYRAARKLEYETVYNLTVSRLNRHYGNLEITGIKDITPVGRETNLDAFYITGGPPDLSAPEFRNEVIDQIQGVYENGWFYYGDNRKIRLYVTDPAIKLKDFSIIRLSRVRIGYHQHPEIVVEKSVQVSEDRLS